MSTYHCSVKAGNKGSGASASAKADYICREGKYADKPDLEHKESGNMPEWAQDSPRVFWHVGDHYERANGRVYTEIELALPREISPEQRRELVQNFIKEQLPGHPYTAAIHNPKAALEGGEQPHAHIIFSERKLDGIERSEEQFFKRAAAPYRDRKTKEMVTPDPAKGGAKKDLSWHKAEKIVEIRKAWEQHYNRYSPEQVTCRSLKAQGISREPESHLGPILARSAAADKTIETRNDRKELEEIEWEMVKLSREIETQDIVAHEKPTKQLTTEPTERKTKKKQDINHTPEQSRRADPDELASRSRNTTSSKREKTEETARLDQVKQPARVQTKAGELLSEANSIKPQTQEPILSEYQLTAIKKLRRVLRNRGDSEKVIEMATKTAVDRCHIMNTETESQIMPAVRLTMTGPEIETVLYNESNRLRELEDSAQDEIDTIPEKREDVVTDLCYKHVPEWHKHDEKTDNLDKNDKLCQERETAWLQAQKNNGWKYLPPLPPEAGVIEQFKRKAVYTVMSKEQLAWQNEGANLKEWRPRIDTVKADLEQERQKLQTETDGLGPQITREADKLMTRRAELGTQRDKAYAREVRIREICNNFPRSTKPYQVIGRDVSSIIADHNLHKQLKDRKELERTLEQSRGMRR
jgi:hypothetical protein